MRLERYHGLGNDYLVLADGPALDPALVQAICDRHRGVGGDGILEPVERPDAEFGVTIWNPDGSIAEKSGNGLRIFARWLVDAGRAAGSFTVSTGPCVVRCDVGDEVVVDMGRASFDPGAVPILGDEPLVDGVLEVSGARLRVVATGVGNPHCVVFVDEPLDTLPWRAWGAALEVHPRFPNRTNVQVARIDGPRSIEIRIWERGAGPTLASGSSACAVAAAAVHTGRLPPGELVVVAPGGVLSVTVSPTLDLRLRGPVERVGRIDVDPAWLATRSTTSEGGA